jgi:glucose-6-phosphate isomerase
MTKPITANLERADIWQKLKAHHTQIADVHLRNLFESEPERSDKYCIRIGDLLIDYSKHRISEETLSLLFSFAETCGIKEEVSAMFSGVKVNTSENRPALHPMLRAPSTVKLELDGENISELVHSQLSRMREFVQRLHAGDVHGANGKPIKTVVNIGIGGSDLGPRLSIEALASLKAAEIDIEFVSNLDPKDLAGVLGRCEAETTLFIVASKSFTTLETRTNADAVKHWLAENGCVDLSRHLVAVTTNQNAAREFGAKDDHIFYFWDWVGGRYSMWSSVGLAIAIAIGMDNFEEMLSGAHVIDTHFQSQPVQENGPVILGLLSIWYNNFFEAESQAVVPYDQSLRLLPEYLSQLVMESNGKSVSRQDEIIQHRSSPILWGGIGTNVQHAFFQLLHQGTHLVPIDFLLPLKNDTNPEQHMNLVSNCLAESEALMLGQVNDADPKRHFPGNTPSTTIAYSTLSANVFGMLIALYEHKTFVEAMLWDINPFDQWGVELGKKLAQNLSQELAESKGVKGEHDASTTLLMKEYLKRNQL